MPQENKDTTLVVNNEWKIFYIGYNDLDHILNTISKENYKIFSVVPYDSKRYGYIKLRVVAYREKP